VVDAVEATTRLTAATKAAGDAVNALVVAMKEAQDQNGVVWDKLAEIATELPPPPTA
jgi:hypothetical protein